MKAGDVVADRFELISVAGKGGMGVVWRAVDRLGQRPVALKAMLAEEQGDVLRFVRETSVLRELSHPRIVRHLADGVTSEGAPWLAMEWLEGEDLTARLRRGALSGSEARALGLGIADALGHAHEKALVHRDLKPSNVWLEDGAPSRVKVLDFGVVRRLGAPTEMERTRAGAVLGTPGYMAPEQARGDLTVDARADIHALGCVLFECLAGRPAFVAEHVLALLAKVLLEAPPRLSSLVSVPRELDELLVRMLAKDPSQRPRDVLEVARELEALPDFDARTVETTRAAPSLAREQRWLCVLLVGIRKALADDVTVVSDVGATGQGVAIAMAAEQSGARLEALAGGAQVLVWETTGSPAELAARAARAALSIHAAGRLLPLALASGRGAMGGSVPVGEALERAAACVTRFAEQIVLDASMAKLLEPGFELGQRDGSVTLLAERARGAGPATLLGRASPCVGRDVELSTLNAALSEVVDEGAAAALLVTGETGMGKSRLRDEWVRALRSTRPEAKVWQAHGAVMHQGARFGIAAELVRDACGLPYGASQEHTRARIEESVTAVLDAGQRARVASRLCEMCGAPWAEDLDAALTTARQNPIAMGDQLRAAWEDFLVASCAEQPVVLVVENLQWADASSLALLDRALRNFARSPWMVLGLGRPEHREKHPRLWEERGAREIILGPLKERSAERLVHAALGKDVTQAVVHRLVARAAGSPYLLEELIRAEAEGRGEQTPETVLAMVEARLLGLGAEERRVLRAASVFGARFDARGVAAVLDEGSAVSMLDGLARREWLLAWPGGEYAFRQETSRDAAYAMLLDEDKRLAHGRAAAFLEASAEPDAASVAEHFERAGSADRAAAWWATAAQRALEANDLRACVARAEAAERCGATGSPLASALMARAEAHQWLGETTAQLATAERLRAISEDAPEWEAIALRWESGAARNLGQSDRLRGVIDRMGRLVAEHGALDVVLECALHVVIDGLPGNLRPQANALGAAVESVEPPLRARAARVRARALQWRSTRAHYDHDVEGFVGMAMEEAELFDRAGLRRNAARTRTNAGYALALLGAYDEARAALEASLAESVRLGWLDSIASVQQNLGLALLGLGRHDEAIATEQEAVTFFTRRGNKYMECGARDYLARILLAAGRIEDAIAEAERAASLLAPDHPMTHLARVALASALVARGAPGDAAEALRHARAAREALRAAPDSFEEVAPVVRVFVEALAANGLTEEASVEREAARAWVHERAAKITSERYRRAFLFEERDNARIVGR